MEIEDADCRSFICWAVGHADEFSFHPHFEFELEQLE